MRVRYALAIFAVGVVALTACSSSKSGGSASQTAFDKYVKAQMPGVTLQMVQAAQKDGAVTIYETTDGANQDAVKEFAKEFPFIKVNAVTLTGSTLAERFESEEQAKLKTGADVVISNTESTALDWVTKGYCGAYTPTSASHYTVGGQPGYIYRFDGTLIGVGWRDGTLTQDQIDTLSTWAGVISPKFVGKSFGVLNITVGGSTTIPNAYFYSTYGTKFFQTFQDNAKAVTIYSGQGPAADALIKGEYDILAPGAVNIMQADWLAGAKIAWAIPTPTISIAADTCLVAAGQHQAAAKLLIEFMLSKTAQAMTANYGDLSYRNDMPPSNQSLTGKATALANASWYKPANTTDIYNATPAQLAALAPDVSTAWKSIIKTKS